MTFTTNNQVVIPDFIYGTAWKEQATANLVKKAVEAGFRGIDTANQPRHYNEALVGDALQSVWQNGLKRDDFFLQTKFTSIDGQDHRLPYDPKADLTTQVEQSFKSSLQHLHTDYIDSYVLHGPHTRFGISKADWEVWKAIEHLYSSKQAKIIGVSNVTAEQLEKLCNGASIKPMVVQNRCYAIRGWDRDVRKICLENNIVYQGFSLLTANANFLNSSVIKAIVRRTGATPAQIIFRFSTMIQILPLTGTTSTQHMAEDLRSNEVDLSDADLTAIENIAFHH